MAAYTTIDDPSAHFQIKLWTGTGSSQTVNFDGNSNLQADWIWHKEQNDTNGWHQTDTSIGIANYLATQDTAAAYAVGSAYVSGIGSNSISYGGGDSSFNSNSVEQATWAWKANGGTTATNTTGSVNSVVQANTDAGFSIATATAPSSNGHWSFGHGLGVKPDMVITRQRTGGGWWTWHKDLTNQTTYYLGLNTTSAETNEASMWGGGMTSSVIGVSSPNSTLANQTYVAYCFASKQGYSKFGTYTGSGHASGPFVYTGFKPAFVMVKCASAAASEWQIYDHKRPGYNFPNYNLSPNNATAEYTGESYHNMDILSNGFKLLLTDVAVNKSGETYTYMAFAEHPFVTSTGIPTTAR